MTDTLTKLENCKKIIARTLADGEGRVTKEELEKIYGKYMAQYEEELRMFDKVITEEDLQDLLEDEDKFIEFTSKYPVTKITSETGDFVLLEATKFEALKDACVIAKSEDDG